MAQYAAPIVIRVANSAELITRHTQDPVVTRQALVQERVVGGEQLEQAAILPNKVIEEKLRLSHQVVAQLPGEIRIEVRLRVIVLHVLEPKPL